MAQVSKKIVSNTGIQFGSRMIQAILGLVTVAFLGRALGPEDFGNYTLIINYAVFFGVLIDLGMEKILLTRLSQNKEQYFGSADDKKNHSITNKAKSLLSTGLILRAIIAVSFFLVAVFFIYTFTNYGNVIRISILLILFSICFDVLRLGESVLKVKLKIWPISASLLLKSFLLLVVAASLFYIRSNILIWIIIGWSLGHILSALFVFAFVLRESKGFKIRYDKKLAKKIFVESFPVGLGMVFGIMYFRIDTFMIHAIAGQAETGYYGAAYKYIDLIITIPVFFITASWPILAERFITKKKKFFNAFQRAFDFLNIISIPAAIGMIFLGSLIIELTYGSDYQPATSILYVLALIFPFIFLWNLYGTLLIILKKRYAYLVVTLIGTILNVGLNLYFIPKYDALGAAMATVLTQLAVFLVVFVLIYRELRYVPHLDKLHRIIFLGLVLVLIEFGISQFMAGIMGDGLFMKISLLLIMALSGLLIYIVGIFKLKIITREDFTTLLRK